MSIDTPFKGYSAKIIDDWIDYNGHLNVGYYHVVFDTAVEPFFHWLGLTPAFRNQHNGSTFALEAHLNYLREVRAGDVVRFETRLLDYDHKRIHFYQEMFHDGQNYLAASHEAVSAYVDMGIRRTAAMPAPILDRLAEVLEAHKALQRPWQIGHAISAHPGASRG